MPPRQDRPRKPVEGRGARSDLACPACADPGTLGVYERQPRTPEREPGFDPIGRACPACGTVTVPRSARGTRACPHESRRAIYLRGPRPRRRWIPYAHRCTACGVLVDADEGALRGARDA